MPVLDRLDHLVRPCLIEPALGHGLIDQVDASLLLSLTQLVGTDAKAASQGVLIRLMLLLALLLIASPLSGLLTLTAGLRCRRWRGVLLQLGQGSGTRCGPGCFRGQNHASARHCRDQRQRGPGRREPSLPVFGDHESSLQYRAAHLFGGATWGSSCPTHLPDISILGRIC
jgi:hypothetical protein